MLFKFWRSHSQPLMQLIESPVSNSTQGIKQIDWEINLTTHSRYQQNISKQSATVLIQPRSQINKDRIMFEISKQDITTILDKIESVL